MQLGIGGSLREESSQNQVCIDYNDSREERKEPGEQIRQSAIAREFAPEEEEKEEPVREEPRKYKSVFE